MDGQWIKQERMKHGMRQCDLAAQLMRDGRQGINQGRIPEQLTALFGDPHDPTN
jgi:hypothetical protein